jgi:DNA-binding SARP family transcriptional activator/predicted ATPase/Flp pilus assembly protein TadD
MEKMRSLQLDFLGQPRFQLDGELLPGLATDKWVGLLAYLSLPQEQMTRLQLEALFWPDSATEQAQGSLRTAVYAINKQLGNPLQTTRKLVWFAPAQAVIVDVIRFRALIQQGDLVSLQTAVSLYRGEFLAGIMAVDAPEFETWLRQERENLRLEMLTALEQLQELYVQNGRLREASQTMRHLLQIEPWHEPAHQQLMRLLARQGDYNGAIKQYQQCQAMLATELGVAPMPETEALYQRIVALRQRPPHNQLPTLPLPLVGREPELEVLTRLLADPVCRLIAITGMGGIGKTSLALATAHQHNRHFLDGITFVSLAELDTAVLLDTAVAEALHIHIPAGSPPRATLCHQLQSQERLLILDNVEQLLPQTEELVQALLNAAPALKIILTSQQKPRLRASLLPLTGLPLPDLTETAVAPTAATTLFSYHARRSQPTFSLSHNWPQVVQLCHLLQGSPLGLELAAAQLDSFDCADLVARLQDQLDELQVDFQDMPPRHRSLRALFSHAWRQLPPAEQAALANLAVFRGGFTIAAADTITQVDKATLHSLLAKSWLLSQNARFTLIHPLIRRLVLEQLGTETAVYNHHALYFSQLLQANGQDELPIPQLLPELDNIQAMWHYALVQQQTDLLRDAAHGLARLYVAINQFAAGHLLFEQAVNRLHQTTIAQTDPLAWGTLLSRYAVFLLRTGRLTAAETQLTQSLAVLRPTGDTKEIAFALNLLGTVSIQAGQFETAVTLLTECAHLYRQLAEPALLLKPLVNLGSAQMRLGHYTTAIDHLHEALPLAQQLNDQRGLTHIYNNLGANYLILGDLATAHAQFTACLPLTEATDYHMVRVVVEQNLAEVCYKQGDWAQAIRHCEASLSLGAKIDDPVQPIRAQKIYALALYAQGKRARAWSLLCQAAESGRAIAAWPTLLDALVGVAQLWLTEGETAVAAELLTAIYHHPATEQQHIQEAASLLAELGSSKIEQEKRPFAQLLDEVINRLRTANTLIANAAYQPRHSATSPPRHY